MKFLDLFAGIGGFRMGMEQAGHECVGYVEIDKFARKSYEAIYDTEGEWTAHDITTVTDNDIRFLRGQVDVICGGFPCQAFSVAGKRGGFQDTRGTLFFDIARLAKQIQPRLLLLENVKGLLSHSSGKTFGTIIKSLDELGYDAEWQVLNSKNFGVPQNRERVFIVGHLRGEPRREVFPIEGENGEPIKVVGQLDGKYRSANEILDTTGSSTCLSTMSGGNREPKILDDQGRTTKKNKLQECVPTLRRESHGNDPKVVTVGNTNPSGKGMNGNVFNSEGLSPTLTTNKGEGPKVVHPVLTPNRPEKRQNGRRFKDDGEEMFTLTSQDRHGIAIKEATNKGYDIAYPGDSVNKTRRGRVGKQVANTLDTGCQQGAVTEELRIRKLTPRECWRLQGFPDWAFDKAQEVNSNSQLYKQAGNSVTVNVIYEIARRLNECNTPKSSN